MRMQPLVMPAINQAGRRRLGIFESRSAQEWLKVMSVLKETGLER